MNIIMLPYKTTSAGALTVAKALNVDMIDREYHKEVPPTAVLNWGRGDFPIWHKSALKWINHPSAVMRAIDKAFAFKAMGAAGVPIPEVTTDIDVAKGWLTKGETIAVLCRQDLQGREGHGIIVARKADQVVPSLLFSKYARKVNEYRVHVVNGEVIYVNVKAKKKQMPAGAEPLVRSGKQGWFFVHLDPHEYPSQAVLDAAKSAVAALGLDFGGVDVGDGQDGIKVYEVNTAPEMGPNTMAAYKEAFKKHFGSYNNSANVPISSI